MTLQLWALLHALCLGALLFQSWALRPRAFCKIAKAVGVSIEDLMK
jgi:hypothetical protein